MVVAVRALLAALLLGWLGLASAAPVRAQEMRFFRIGTGGVAGTYYPIGGLIADIISNPPGARPCPASCPLRLYGTPTTSGRQVRGIRVDASASPRHRGYHPHADAADVQVHRCSVREDGRCEDQTCADRDASGAA